MSSIKSSSSRSSTSSIFAIDIDEINDNLSIGSKNHMFHLSIKY